MLFSAAVRRERTNAFGNHIHNPFMQCDFSTTSFSKMCQISNSGLTVILRFAGIIVNLFRETSKPPPALLPMKLRSGSLRGFPAAGRNEIRYILCRTQMQSSSAFRSDCFPQSLLGTRAANWKLPFSFNDSSTDQNERKNSSENQKSNPNRAEYP